MKKRNTNVIPSPLHGRKKFLLIMKLALAIIFFGVLQVNANIYSQNKMDLDLQNKSIKEVLRIIEQRSDFRFFYSDNIPLMGEVIDVNLRDKTVTEVLDDIFLNKELTYQLFENNLIVVALKQPVQNHKVTGTVTDAATGEPLPGVSILVKGTTLGTSSDVSGSYTIQMPDANSFLTFSFVGYLSEEIAVEGRQVINITLLPDIKQLEEIVVVGYGEQKKESVVGAIVQTGSKELLRSGASDVGQALTGLLPGVVTIQSTGMPGDNDPKIFIRGLSSWNGGQPLILVDGIERSMSDIDVNEVESISVLKDASATAVFGVKGAEGVILINTKRGQAGKSKLEFSYRSSFKFNSRLPEKLNSYESLLYRNNAIENELSITEQEWNRYVPMHQLLRYKRSNQQPGDEYIFPDVDWTDELLGDYGLDHQANININGGSEFVKYFGSLGYLHEGDILEGVQAYNTPYSPGYNYDRLNFRTNLDLNVTKSTTLSINLSGNYGIQKKSYASDNDVWQAIYETAPFSFPITHQNEEGWDGTIWGYNIDNVNVKNPIKLMSNSGINNLNNSQITTDFILKQKLDKITSGLSFLGRVSYDNSFNSASAIYDGTTNQLHKYINPNIVDKPEGVPDDAYISYTPTTGNNDFDFSRAPIQFQSEKYTAGSNFRKLSYEVRLEYKRTFGIHDVTAMTLFKREELARGNEFPRYREDWVGRFTYQFKNKYILDLNGAYNGSEKFGPGYRFGFFPSAAVGWIVNRESFMKSTENWLSLLKFRFSMGKVGSDNFAAPRWSYTTQWANDDGENWRAHFGQNFNPSIYPQYIEGVIGNPDLQWEIVTKRNFAVETGFLNNRIRFNVDFFSDNRDKIFMTSTERNQPDYFGGRPVAANIGKSKSRGYEVELNLQNNTSGGFHYWGNFNFAHSKDEVVFREDPELRAAYRKSAGFQIGQTKATLNNGFVNNWDDVYATTGFQSNNHYKMPGDLFLVDFNADGIIDGKDEAPYAFTERPQNTYNYSVGFDWKGFSAMVQFYGVFNSTMKVALDPFKDGLRGTVFEETTDIWTPSNLDASYINPRFATGSSTSTLMLYDGSYLRLKTVELAYTFEGKKSKLPFKYDSLRFFVNGNNLAMWSDLPDDRESYAKSYPMFKKVSLGLNLIF